MSLTIGYAPGAFDLFHIGHLNALRFARERCDILIAGVVSDEICRATKGVTPMIPTHERAEIVSSLRIVDQVYIETTTSKLDAWRTLGFDLVFKGDDWRGTRKGINLEELLEPHGVEVCYFPYTMHTSSTQLRRAVSI